MIATEVAVLHALRARGCDVAAVEVLAGQLRPSTILAAPDGARWRVERVALTKPATTRRPRGMVALRRARRGRLPAIGEHLVARGG